MRAWIHRKLITGVALAAGATVMVAQEPDEPPPPPPPDISTQPIWTVAPPNWTEYTDQEWGFTAALSSEHVTEDEVARQVWGRVHGIRSMGCWPEIHVQRLQLLPTGARFTLDSLAEMLWRPGTFPPPRVEERKAHIFDGREALSFELRGTIAAGTRPAMLVRTSAYEVLAFSAWVPAEDRHGVKQAAEKFFASIRLTDTKRAGKILQAPLVLMNGVRYEDDTVGYGIDLPFFPERQSAEELGPVRVITDWSGRSGLPLVAVTSVIDRSDVANPGMTLDATLLTLKSQLKVVREELIEVDKCPAAILEVEEEDGGNIFAIVIDAPGNQTLNVMVDPGLEGADFVTQVRESIDIRPAHEKR